jgi:hypothetical protein
VAHDDADHLSIFKKNKTISFIRAQLHSKSFLTLKAGVLFSIILIWGGGMR